MTRRCGFIALAGRPNAGKSTFMNKALGEKVAIVSDKPQTTRNRILGVYHSGDIQIGFLDLPGIHKPEFDMNRHMMRTVYQGLKDADVVFHFIDLTAPVGKGDEFAHEAISRVGVPVILVANKADLVNKQKMIPLLDKLQQRFEPAALVPISAKAGDNVDHLIETAEPYLPESEFLFSDDDLTDQPLRFMVQEFIRERILDLTRDEIPHAVAVTLDSYEWDEEEQVQFIAARIWVERASQRRIILGRGGALIKRIRLSAQRALRDLVGQRVAMELYVTVEKNWRNEAKSLRDLNLTLPD